MKKISMIIVCMMIAMTSFAQQTEHNLAQIKGEELKNIISDPERKAEYIEAVNKASSASNKWGAEIYDVSLVKNDSAWDACRDSITASAKLRNGQKRVSINDATGLFSSYHLSYHFRYNSVDGQNHVIRLSGMIYVNVDGRTNKAGILNCHPTVTANSECPTGSNDASKKVYSLADDDYFIVCPDYCGYGVSAFRQHPYLVQDVTARNCIDGYFAAIELGKEMGMTFASFDEGATDKFYTLILGYSQGGSVALACQKYVEGNILTDEEKSIFNLKHTYCGDGPYSPLATVDKYMAWANDGDVLDYPCVLPLIVMGAKNAYDKDCMRTVNIEDYFTPEFIASGVLDDISSKGIITTMINAKSIAAGTNTVATTFSDKMLMHVADSLCLNTGTNECACLMRVLEKNDLTKGWTPQHKVSFFHFSGDRVVPYVNFEEVKKNVDSGIWSSDVVDFYDASQVYSDLSGFWSLAAWISCGSNRSAWTHESTGTLFYIWLFSGKAPDL